MSQWRKIAALAVIALAVGQMQARAEMVTIQGTLIGHALPMTYSITNEEMYFKDNRPYIEVAGQGDCHYEPHENCYFVGNPPHYVCYPEGQWQCFNDAAEFALPADQLKLESDDVFYTGGGKHLKVGHVKHFLFWKWIALESNAHLQSTQATAALVVDVAGAAGHALDRTETFATLHGTPRDAGFMVRFTGVSNDQARHILRACGYEGQLAPCNDWSKTDVSRDEIGIAISPDRASDLIGKLRADERVLGIRPVQ